MEWHDGVGTLLVVVVRSLIVVELEVETISYDVQFNYVIPLCDEYSIPLATNIATAEMLLKGMNNGDLEWRNLYR